MSLPFDIEGFNWRDHSELVVLTGAGVSAESGIKTFRDTGGLWENHSIQEVATPEGFEANPELVISFYDQRRAQLDEVEPNPAHEALAELERALGDRLLVVTQNVDDLHERAGQKNLLHMHGSLKSLRCRDFPHHKVPWEGPQDRGAQCHHCDGDLRPDIVWFGEEPYHMEVIMVAIQNCTHFASIGTSSQVYPAAGFKDMAKAHGAKVVEINLECSSHDPSIDYHLEGPASQTLPAFVDALCQRA